MTVQIERSRNKRRRKLLLLWGVLATTSFAACDSEYGSPIVPTQIAIVEMSDHLDSLEHDVGILIPAGFKHERKEIHNHRWDRVSDGVSVLVAYGFSPGDDRDRMFAEARDPCHEQEDTAYPAVTIRREAFRDGFQVLCGMKREGTVQPLRVERFIRLDRTLLNCEIDHLRKLSPASVRNAWDVCASIQVRRPHISDPQPWQSDGPWTMELTTFADGWTGWRSVELSVPVTRPLDADEYWKPPKHWNPDAHDWERPEDR